MIGWMSRLSILGLLLLSCPWAEGAPKEDWLTRFNAWSCRVTGFGCARNAVSVAKYRGSDSSRPPGGALVIFDPGTRGSRVLWADCHCWSPVPLGVSQLAVSTGTGITVVPVEKPQQRRTVAQREFIQELLGVEFFHDRSMMLLRSPRSSKEAECEFEPARLRQPDFIEEPLPGVAELECGTDLDFVNLTKPAQVVGDRTLRTLRYRGRLSIVIESGGQTQSVFPTGSGRNGQQFDPVWIGRDLIAFIETP